MQTRLLGMGTAVPPHAASQSRAAAFMEKVILASGHPRADSSTSLLRRIYEHSGIIRRHSVLQDFGEDDPARFTFFPPNWSLSPPPTTSQRMAVYETHAVDLAEVAARAAMEESGVRPDQITHLVLSTCTGFFAPGPDIHLVRRLGLPVSTVRTILGFMGCYAGVSALRTCHQIIQAQPSAVVLQVAVELCSLHYQLGVQPDTIVSNALFADGAAAVLYAGESFTGEAATESRSLCVLATHSAITPESLDHMTWRIGDHGFIMTLDAGVPAMIQAAAPRFVADLAAAAGIQVADIWRWVIHPGGRKIIEAVAHTLTLSPSQVASSFQILSDYGNMSSASILFVLGEELRSRPQNAGDITAVLAFGPGLAMEGALLVSR